MAKVKRVRLKVFNQPNPPGKVAKSRKESRKDRKEYVRSTRPTYFPVIEPTVVQQKKPPRYVAREARNQKRAQRRVLTEVALLPC